MEGNEPIKIKVSSKFRTTLPILHIPIPLFIPIAGGGIIFTLNFENSGKKELTKMNFRWKIVSEKIDIGKNEKPRSIMEYEDIYDIELLPGDKEKRTFYASPSIPGHHKLVVGVPKEGDAIVGESGETVAGTEEQERITFYYNAPPKIVAFFTDDKHTDERASSGPWVTYFEVYSWYLLAISIGTLSAFVYLFVYSIQDIFLKVGTYIFYILIMIWVIDLLRLKLKK